MILRIVEAVAFGPRRLRLAFNEGTHKTVDVSSLLEGPVFEPLRDPTYFAQVQLDRVCGTVVWPNGADLDPDVLHGDRQSASNGDARVVREYRLQKTA